MDTAITTPQLSVIMPVYNAALYLREAIDSVLNQTFTNYEFIIVDDGSSDGSVSIIKSYTDDRIQFIQNPTNLGLITTLNNAIKHCKGKYIARMDADDVCVADRFLLQYNYLEQHSDVLLLGTFFKIIGNDAVVILPTTHDELKFNLLAGNKICHPSVVMRTSFFANENNYYSANYAHAEDYELWTRIAQVGKIENLPIALLNYRMHATQVSSVKQAEQLLCANAIRIKQLQQLISFDNATYSKEFIIGVFTQTTNRISCKELVLLKQFIYDVYTSNLKTQQYNNAMLSAYLREVWLKYSFACYNYNIALLHVVLPIKTGGITTLSAKAIIKYVVKSIIGYKAL
jgi:glycosyltransferase involved in cell wall biosynthesis